MRLKVEGCREAWGLARILLWCYCTRLWHDFCLWIRCKRWRFQTEVAKISGEWVWSCLEFGCSGARNCSKLEGECNFCKCRSSDSYENYCSWQFQLCRSYKKKRCDWTWCWHRWISMAGWWRCIWQATIISKNKSDANHPAVEDCEEQQ